MSIENINDYYDVKDLLNNIDTLNKEIDYLKHQLKLATDKDYRLDWLNNEWLPRNGLKNGN